MFDIYKVSINDLETLLKVMTSGIATYDIVLRDFPGKDKTPLVDIYVHANNRTCAYMMILDKASLASLESMFINVNLKMYSFDHLCTYLDYHL